MAVHDAAWFLLGGFGSPLTEYTPRQAPRRVCEASSGASRRPLYPYTVVRAAVRFCCVNWLTTLSWTISLIHHGAAVRAFIHIDRVEFA